MSFEMIEPRGPVGGQIGERQVSIGKNGLASVPSAMLAEIKVENRVVVLADAATMRVGFRRPDNGEPAFAVGGRGKRRIVSLAGALRLLNLDGRAAAGRYGLQIHKEHGKPALLTVLVGNLADAGLSAGQQRARDSAKAARGRK